LTPRQLQAIPLVVASEPRAVGVLLIRVGVLRTIVEIVQNTVRITIVVRCELAVAPAFTLLATAFTLLATAFTLLATAHLLASCLVSTALVRPATFRTRGALGSGRIGTGIDVGVRGGARVGIRVHPGGSLAFADASTGAATLSTGAVLRRLAIAAPPVDALGGLARIQTASGEQDDRQSPKGS
jgi:hypothetical protein